MMAAATFGVGLVTRKLARRIIAPQTSYRLP